MRHWLKFTLLLCLVLFSFQELFDADKVKDNMKNWTEGMGNWTQGMYNKTERISEYFGNNSMVDSIVDKWNTFTDSLYNLFTRHPRAGTAKDLQHHIKDFNRKISDYLKKNMPNENYTELLGDFSDKMSSYIKDAGGKGTDYLKNFSDKFYDFSDNISDYLEQSFKDTDKKLKPREKFTNFLDRIGDYFRSNYTKYNDYYKNYKEGTLKDTDYHAPDTLLYLYHKHESYRYPDKHKSMLCSEAQLDRCGHKCAEQKKVLCGCYVIKANRNKKPDVDCVCADSKPMCDVKHTHVDAGKDPKKDI
jgi:hypothetical protein